MPRYLSKSRFKTALECPTKLDYVGKPEYVDTKKTNDFLRALAEGGFQVGELAKLIYPEGVEVTDREQADQIARTKALLQQVDATIFEGTVQYGDWLARIDVILKRGNKVQLIEVKSKSFDSRLGTPDEQWRGSPPKDNPKALGAINSKMLPYLQDVAFQTMLFRKAFPELEVTPYLMMPDKAKVATIDGLNQKFKIHKTGTGENQRSWAATVPGTALNSLGNTLLEKIPVDKFVEDIVNGTIKSPGGESFFEPMAMGWAKAYAAQKRIQPVIGKHCRSCEFFCVTPDESHKSGFHQCWTEATHKSFADIIKDRPITELYYPVRNQVDNLIKSRGFWLANLDEGDFEEKKTSKGLSRTKRQMLQVFGQWNSDNAFIFDKALWNEDAAKFRFPLHFIDFEGARPALPFVAGKRPYSQIAFQFSHHVMESDGTVAHANEFLDLTPGHDPSIDFLRALKVALCAPGYEVGTVFMWSPYENTMLNGLRSDLLELKATGNAPEDADELIDFAESLTTRKVGKDRVARGHRAMVDLNLLASQCFFHPDTKGRTSIKVTLPAVMKASDWLKNVYSQPIYGQPGGISSKNFPIEGAEGMTWWVPDAAGAKNPYDLLPPIFADIPQAELDGGDQEEGEDILEGGAATTAYARMQFEDVPVPLRDATRKALLRYCELDTLAMVMIYQAWSDWGNA